MTFIEVDICHPVGPLRLLYSVTLTFIFKFKHFLVMHLLNKMCKQQMSPAYLSWLIRPPWSCSWLEMFSVFKGLIQPPSPRCCYKYHITMLIVKLSSMMLQITDFTSAMMRWMTNLPCNWCGMMSVGTAHFTIHCWNSQVAIEYFSIYRKDRSEVKGGCTGWVIVYVRESIISVSCEELNKYSTESVRCKVMVDKGNVLTIGVRYKVLMWRTLNLMN